MKFRMFTKKEDGMKCAVNVDEVMTVSEHDDFVAIMIKGHVGNYDTIICAREDFDTVLSRLNTIAK